jgi:hypothetical protein
LRSLGVRFAQQPTDLGPATTAVFRGHVREPDRNRAAQVIDAALPVCISQQWPPPRGLVLRYAQLTQLMQDFRAVAPLVMQNAHGRAVMRR